MAGDGPLQAVSGGRSLTRGFLDRGTLILEVLGQVLLDFEISQDEPSPAGPGSGCHTDAVQGPRVAYAPSRWSSPQRLG